MSLSAICHDMIHRAQAAVHFLGPSISRVWRPSSFVCGPCSELLTSRPREVRSFLRTKMGEVDGDSLSLI